MKKIKNKLLYPFICLFTAIVWGSGFPLQDKAGQYSHILDTFTFNGLRFLIAGIVLIPIVLIFEREPDIPKEEKPKRLKYSLFCGAVSGLLLAFAAILQQLGIQLTGESGKAAFITGMYLVIVPVAAFIIFKQKTSIFVWASIPVALVGLFLLSVSSGFSVQVGDILVLVCAFGYASQIIFIDRFGKNASSLKMSCTQFFVASAACLLLGLIFGNTTWEGITTNIIPILYCGAFSAGMGFTLQIIGQKHTPPALASLLFAMEGLFATIFEAIFEQSLPTNRMLIGCGLMLFAIILSQIPAKQKNEIEKFKS